MSQDDAPGPSGEPYAGETLVGPTAEAVEGAGKSDARRGAAAPTGETEAEKDSKPKSYSTILEEEIFQGLNELERPAGGLFLSGLSAGLDIGFSVLLMGVVLTILGGDLSDPATHMLVGNMYAVGFILVIIGRSELFTEHTALAVFPVLGGRAGIDRLARLWGLIYASNLLGALVFARILAWVAPPLSAVDPAAFGTIAAKLVHHPWYVILTSGLLAGWLMGLLSWTLSAARETISRIFLVWLITGAIGLAGLHHSIVGTVEVLAGVFSGYQSWGDYGHFIVWTTLGNAGGGVVFVALIKYSHAVKGPWIPGAPNQR